MKIIKKGHALGRAQCLFPPFFPWHAHIRFLFPIPFFMYVWCVSLCFDIVFVGLWRPPSAFVPISSPEPFRCWIFFFSRATTKRPPAPPPPLKTAGRIKRQISFFFRLATYSGQCALASCMPCGAPQIQKKAPPGAPHCIECCLLFFVWTTTNLFLPSSLFGLHRAGDRRRHTNRRTVYTFLFFSSASFLCNKKKSVEPPRQQQQRPVVCLPWASLAVGAPIATGTARRMGKKSGMFRAARCLARGRD